jgi:glycosyltransferase 2 family protein
MVGQSVGKKIQFWFGIGISCVLVCWLIFTCDWEEVQKEVVGIHIWMLIPAVLLFIFHFVLRAVRWRLLLGDQEKKNRPSLSLLFDGMMVGNLATFLLPLRVGEFVRPYMLSRCSDSTFALSFVSVVLERFFDLSSVLLSFGLLLLFLDPVKQEINPIVYDGAFFLSGVAGLILVFILSAVYLPKQLLAIAKMGLSIFPAKLRTALLKFLEEFLVGATVLRSGSLLLQVILWSVVIWASTYARFWISLAAFPTIDPSILLSVGAGVLVSLAIAAPSAPGFVGVYEAGCIAAFALFGLSKESATAYAIVTHVLEYILVGLFGCIALFRNDLKLGDLTKRPG